MPTTTTIQAYALVIFGLAVAGVRDGASDERNLEVVELWSGVEAIVWAAIAAGFAAVMPRLGLQLGVRGLPCHGEAPRRRRVRAPRDNGGRAQRRKPDWTGLDEPRQARVRKLARLGKARIATHSDNKQRGHEHLKMFRNNIE